MINFHENSSNEFVNEIWFKDFQYLTKRSFSNNNFDILRKYTQTVTLNCYFCYSWSYKHFGHYCKNAFKNKMNIEGILIVANEFYADNLNELMKTAY